MIWRLWVQCSIEPTFLFCSSLSMLAGSCQDLAGNDELQINSNVYSQNFAANCKLFAIFFATLETLSIQTGCRVYLFNNSLTFINSQSIHANKKAHVRVKYCDVNEIPRWGSYCPGLVLVRMEISRPVPRGNKYGLFRFECEGCILHVNCEGEIDKKKKETIALNLTLLVFNYFCSAFFHCD